MTTKYINIIYLFLVVISAFVTIFYFYLWNNPYPIPNQLHGQILNNLNIEQCQISPKRIFIRGWGYIKDKQLSYALLYAQRTDGSLLPIEKTTENRQDVKDPFQNAMPFNTFGFVGSKRLFWPQSFTKVIFIVKKSADGQTYFAQHTCQ